MRLGKGSLLLVVAAILLASLGCAAEEGAYNGVVDGLKKAVSAAITTPVDNFLANLFP
jgi:hypothetical protein